MFGWLLLWSLCLPAACSFSPSSLLMYGTILRRTHSSLHMGRASGRATTLEGKQDMVQRISGMLNRSELIFSVPADTVKVQDIQTLRRALPEGSTAAVVKNTLMERAIEGTRFQDVETLLKGSNLWFFVERDFGTALKAWDQFIKEAGIRETHEVRGGWLEGQVFDAAGMAEIAALPSKKELMAKLALLIKAIPTRLARAIKAPSSKLALVLKLALLKQDDAPVESPASAET